VAFNDVSCLACQVLKLEATHTGVIWCDKTATFIRRKRWHGQNVSSPECDMDRGMGKIKEPSPECNMDKTTSNCLVSLNFEHSLEFQLLKS
jgi:hypothetical protein